MPYYSVIILNSFYNRFFPKLFRHNRRMPTYHLAVLLLNLTVELLVIDTQELCFHQILHHKIILWSTV